MIDWFRIHAMYKKMTAAIPHEMINPYLHIIFVATMWSNSIADILLQSSKIEQWQCSYAKSARFHCHCHLTLPSTFFLGAGVRLTRAVIVAFGFTYIFILIHCHPVFGRGLLDLDFSNPISDIPIQVVHLSLLSHRSQCRCPLDLSKQFLEFSFVFCFE